MYELIFDKEAIEFLEKCEKKAAKREKLTSAKKKPRHFFERRRKDYKLRIGDYRVIADINDKENRDNIDWPQKKHLQESLRWQKSILKYSTSNF